jgi:hypothetical protein
MRKIRPISPETEARLAAHRAWCARWTVTHLSSGTEARDFIAGHGTGETEAGPFVVGWGGVRDVPPIPCVGSHYAATRFTDGAWFFFLMDGGDPGISDTTPGSPASVFMFTAVPVV